MRKFIILNNGLRDHRGHYFETSIAIAEAARRAGLHPILATHVDCRTDLLPMWLESYPIFCTDHWMSEPPADPPDLSELHLDPYASPRPTIRETRGGQASTRQFLAARFRAVAEKPETGSAKPGRSQRLISGLQKTRWACRKMVWLFDRLGFFFLPPILDEACRIVSRHCVPRVLRNPYRDRFKSRAAGLLRRLSGDLHARGENGVGPETACNLQLAFEGPKVRQALDALRPLGLERELDNSLIFKRDLERLLALTAAGPNDFLLLGTAHAREILAVQLVADRLGPARAPWFHLEFRHPLFQTDPSDAECETSANIRMQKAFLSLYESSGPSDRIKFFTDTEELSEDYQRIAAVPFGVLPIPFRAELIAAPQNVPGRPLRLGYLGEPRDEKGFPWLGRLIEDLMEDYVLTGRVEFVFQANISAPQYNPQSASEIEILKNYPPNYVRLVGLDAPLSPEQYYALVSEMDAVLAPYDRNRYRACSSGTLAEAIAGGRPAIVPTKSWLSARLPAGAGLAFDDYDSFVESVKRLVENYQTYQACAESSRAAWLADHAPDRLIEVLLESMRDRKDMRGLAA